MTEGQDGGQGSRSERRAVERLDPVQATYSEGERDGAATERVAVFIPSDRDREAVGALLAQDGLVPTICSDLAALVMAFPAASFAVVAEEALTGPDLVRLVETVESQPGWSDYPFILLAPKDAGADRDPFAHGHMRALGNVSFLEWPFHPTTFVSLARAARSSRLRQRQARDRLVALEASRAKLGESDERLSFALEAGNLGAWQLGLAGGRPLTVSDIFLRNMGLPPETALTYEGLLASIHPDDRDRVVTAAQGAIDGRTDLEVDCRIVPPDGQLRWLEVRGRASYADGQPRRMAGVTLDITDRKQAAERQELLIRELHHRVKNTLSTVQAIVGSTARGARSIDEFYNDFTGRIISLANTHTILTEQFWQRASLRELLSKELDLYDGGHERVRVDGPDLELPSDYAVPLGMAFHELTTNAAKYGALSNGDGRVFIGWAIEPAPGQAPGRMRIAWREEGGPPVSPPTRTGFGTRLLQRVLAAQVKAEVDVIYDPAGVRVSVSFDLPVPAAGDPLLPASGRSAPAT